MDLLPGGHGGWSGWMGGRWWEEGKLEALYKFHVQAREDAKEEYTIKHMATKSLN